MPRLPGPEGYDFSYISGEKRLDMERMFMYHIISSTNERVMAQEA